jgi:hypothetical protein
VKTDNLGDQKVDERIILKWFSVKLTVTEYLQQDSEVCGDYFTDSMTTDFFFLLPAP